MDAASDDMPLKGIRVLELGSHIAGPLCGMTLGDMGADVIKIESIDGDDGRRWGTWTDHGRSFLFLAVNRNKKSLSLDLQVDEGQRVLDELVSTADIVIQSMSSDASDKLDLTAQRYRAQNANAIFCSVSGYGHRSSRRQERAFDQILQAETGIMAMASQGREMPGRLPVSAIDVVASQAAVGGICAELARPRRQFAELEVSLFAAAMTLLSYWVPEVAITGRSPSPDATRFTLMAPVGSYASSDKYFVLGVGTDRLWRRLCSAMGRDDLASEKRYLTNRDRVENRAALDQDLTSEFARKKAHEWVSIFRAAGIPCAAVEDVDVAIMSKFAAEEFHVLEDPSVSGAFLPGPIARASRDAAGQTLRRSAPRLGEHSREILLGLGLSETEIVGLQNAGAVKIA